MGFFFFLYGLPLQASHRYVRYPLEAFTKLRQGIPVGQVVCVLPWAVSLPWERS